MKNANAVTKPAIIILTGASGAGKTTLALRFGELGIAGIECINCDRVTIETPASCDPSDSQVRRLLHWLSEIGTRMGQMNLVVLDTQIRPHMAMEALEREGFVNSEVVLVDCDPIKRNERLRSERQQPELITAQMDCWAAYLRGQADALNLAIIDTSEDPIEVSLENLRALVEKRLRLSAAIDPTISKHLATRSSRSKI